MKSISIIPFSFKKHLSQTLTFGYLKH